MTKMLEIAQLGNPILRSFSENILEISDQRIQDLIDSLIATTITANGVGIAAPQLSQAYRLFIVASRPNPRYPQAPKMEATAMINPRITAHNQEIVKDWEGCLSVPDIRALVPRHQTIEVEYFNRKGELQQQKLTDFVARIFQHELDHLDGLVFLDRIESNRDIVTEQEYQRLQENK